MSNCRSSGSASSKKRRKLWNANFVCLASIYGYKVPTSSEKEMLRKAGLGVRKIQLDLEEDEQKVLQRICSDAVNDDDEEEEKLPLGYPQLAECGGFELLVCQSNSKDLVVLNCSLKAKDLKASLGASQSRIYIRPIQKNLSLRPIVKSRTSQRSEKCFHCLEVFPIAMLRSHVLSCKSPTTPTLLDDSSSTAEEDDDEVLLPEIPGISRSKYIMDKHFIAS